ncbi:glycoside hydrolase family 92 protein [Hortaea werneckii]|nr:glycoside hydrolase family 92 protein [Hortaea werneckii]
MKLIIWRLTLLPTPVLGQISDPLKYVDPLIGSSNGGNVFPGATLPYGMAKASADTDSESNQGGFTTDGSNVTGPSLGNFALFPYASCKNDEINGCVFPKRARAEPYVNGSVVATPGFFGITLQSGIQAAMTTAMHTSLFEFTFQNPPSSVNSTGSPLILMDLTDLSNSRQDNASISVDPDTGRMTGNGRFLPSFGSGNYVAYFCADFSGPALRDTGIYVNSRGSADVKSLKISRSINGYPLPGGAFVRFVESSPVSVRVGLSFLSSEQACSNAETEIPAFDFNATRSAAANAWRRKLSPVSVSTTGVNHSLITNFYSGIYRTMVNPQNSTGTVPLVSRDTIWFDSFYCLWDSFRSQIPFLTVRTPMEKVSADLEFVLGLCKGFTQGGSNADIVLADAFAKINHSDIDWSLAYEAVVKDAEVEPYDWCCEGRGGLDSWKRLGYIPVQDFDYKGFGTMTRSISRTLEYSYNDFCISRIAAGLGNHIEAEKYQHRSRNWLNLFRGDQTSFINGSDTGFTGFFQPKFLNGTWGFQDPLHCSNIDTDPTSVCSLQNNGSETFESSIWDYFVPHDQSKLISIFGGPDAFVRRLDYLHDQQITYIGNEPAFLTVFQYHYAGRPALSAKRAHFYIPEYFQPTNGGLPGNDDSGAMGSFVAFSMMGLFPNPGQDVYLITPPFFQEVNITSPVTRKTACIRTVGFDSTYRAIYIQKATLDGQPYTKNWIDHSFFTQGRELVLYLGRNESTWGTQVVDLPPSLGSYEDV